MFGWYEARRTAALKAEPHAGLLALLVITQSRDLYCVTSNVGGLLQKTGFGPERAFEVHGSFHRRQCMEACDLPRERNDRATSGRGPSRSDEDAQPSALPSWPAPNVMRIAGDGYDFTVGLAQQDAFRSWLDAARGPLVVIEVGAGQRIQTIRGIVERCRGRTSTALPSSATSRSSSTLAALGRFTRTMRASSKVLEGRVDLRGS